MISAWLFFLTVTGILWAILLPDEELIERMEEVE